MSKAKSPKADASAPDSGYVGCRVMELPAEDRHVAAKRAIDINPGNRPRLAGLANLIGEEVLSAVLRPAFLAELTTKFWGSQGVKLGVSFLDNAAADLRNRIIDHMNAWKDVCNVSFAWSQSQGDVRIARANSGYWSYLGTDITHIPAGQATMNLQGFTMNTAEAEYHRVVRHETGHTLGFPHEHMRREIIARLDPQKTIDYFQRYQGWSATETQQQVLTPLEESSIMGSPGGADQLSIMCYALPAAITVDGRAIPGGSDIDPVDREFAGKLYPKVSAPPPAGGRIVIQYTGSITSAVIVPG